MRTGLYQGADLRQELRVNPRLYQAMDLLYMPLLDLQTRLEQELSENPFLELTEPDSDDEFEVDAEEDSGDEQDDEIDWDEVLLDGFDTGGPREKYEPREEFESPIVGVRHLQDYLNEQLGFLHLDDRQAWIAGEIVGNIDDDGFLSCTLQDVADGLNGSAESLRDAALSRAREIEDEKDREEELAELARIFAPHTPDEVEPVLRVVQSLDPAGVGARDLQECLDLQMQREGQEDALALAIVRDHFDALGNHRWAEIARTLEVSPKAVQDAADEIARLDPRPGRRYAADPDHYVIPDLIVDKVGGEYLVFVNDTGLPRLRLAQAYREVAADRSKYVGENREFIANKLNAANWLIQVIEQRRQTMLGVMRFIVDRQSGFFEKGVQHLKPLTLREVAEHIGMAESTVSRVTNEKYVQSPAGVYPLKFFFSGGLPTAMGKEVSSRGVQARVKSLVDAEDRRRPLTDQAIVNLLKGDGVKIARRTVAKYRDQLGILPARMRKRI